MSACTRLIAPLLIALAHSTTIIAADLDHELTALIRDYDVAQYESASEEARIKALSTLMQRAEQLAQQHPARGEPLVWKGLLQADVSAAERSLSLVKQARKTLEAALAINPNGYAVDGYSTLGAMYANVPGFPIAFGDKKKARECFQKALAINPASLRANLNYAQLLFKQDDYAGAVKYATKALTAPPRPGREKADKAARTSAEALITKAQEKLRSK